MKILFRKSTEKDLPILTDVYNEAIRKGDCTCDTKEFSVEERRDWLNEHNSADYPLFTCTVDNKIAGYIYLSPYRGGRNALRRAAEVSYYFSSNYHNLGIGSKSMEFIIEEARKTNIEILIAILLDCNKPSIKLLEKYQFEEWGRMPRCAELKGKFVDHIYLGRFI